MKLLNSYEAMQPEGQFFMAFLSAMLWSTPYDVDNDDCYEYMDEVYSFINIDQTSADMLKQLCKEFIEKAGHDAILENNYSQAGHDFWLTIAKHACGFWDGGWPENGEELNKICEDWIKDAYCYSDGDKVYCDISI